MVQKKIKWDQKVKKSQASCMREVILSITSRECLSEKSIDDFHMQIPENFSEKKNF
jgi:hypothetical protein